MEALREILGQDADLLPERLPALSQKAWSAKIDKAVYDRQFASSLAPQRALLLQVNMLEASIMIIAHFVYALYMTFNEYVHAPRLSPSPPRFVQV